jgi:hypothetical protein
MVGLAYGVYVVHDLFFVLVIGADLLGRFVMVALIVRANLLTRDKTATWASESSGRVQPGRVQPKVDFQPARERRLIAYQPKVLVLGRARGS